MGEIRLLNVLIDLNLIFDIFLSREPWLSEARNVWAAHHRRAIIGHIPAHGLTNLFYIARRILGAEKAREAVGVCLRTSEVLPVGRVELELAQTLGGVDLEDNLVLACAKIAGPDAIVTRDPKGFAGASLTVWSPAGLLSRLP